MNYVFKVQDKIFDIYTGHTANVTELTEKGFKYTYDEPVPLGPRFGVQLGGECYRIGFDCWEHYTGTNKIKKIETIYTKEGESFAASNNSRY